MDYIDGQFDMLKKLEKFIKENPNEPISTFIGIQRLILTEGA